MVIRGLIWRPEMIEKLASKHSVTEDEVEEVFANSPHYRFREKGRRRLGKN